MEKQNESHKGNNFNDDSKEKICSSSEDILRDKLIDFILMASAFVSVSAYSSAFIRAFSIGFSYRDIIQVLAGSTIIVLSMIRKRINSNQKAFLLIVAYSVGGLSGFFSFGMLGGAIFLFPTALVVVAIFYSVRITLIYILFSLLFFCLVAMKFCIGTNSLELDVESLMSNHFHWIVYILCILFFSIVTCITIHKYRKLMKMLIDKVKQQREYLKSKNNELSNALENVRTLKGLLPICSHCKKIRDDKGYWKQIESYISENSEAEFSHSICQDCAKKYYPDLDIYDAD